MPTAKLKDICGRESEEIVRGDSSAGGKDTLSIPRTRAKTPCGVDALVTALLDSETGRGIPGACWFPSLAYSVNSRPQRDLICRKVG